MAGEIPQDLITPESMPGYDEFQAQAAHTTAQLGPDVAGHASDEVPYVGGDAGYRPTQPHGNVINHPDSLAMLQAAAESYGSAHHARPGINE